MTISEENPPHAAIQSMARFVIAAGSDVIAEFQNTPEAVRALAQYAARNSGHQASIYRRAASSWVKY